MARNLGVLLKPFNASLKSNFRNSNSGKCLAISLAILSCQMAAYASEESTPRLHAQQGTMDDTKPEPKTLNGNIERTEVLDGAGAGEPGLKSKAEHTDATGDDLKTTKPSLSDNAESDDQEPVVLDAKTQEDLGKVLNSSAGLFKLFFGKSSFSPVIQLGSRKPLLSSEEYRKMEYGIIGLDAVIHIGSTGPVVEHVHPGAPAEVAGILEGDLIVKAQDHVFKPGEGQRVLWQTVAGRAGTPVEMSVLRDGEVIKFKLVRMNIEDIPDKTRRRQYEMLLSALGPPHYNADGDLAESAKKDTRDLNRLSRFGSKQKYIIDLESAAAE